MERTTITEIVQLLRNMEPEYAELEDDEVIAVLHQLIGMVNVAAYHLGIRKHWILFKGTSRSTQPALHEPQAVEVEIWRKV